MRRQSPGDAYYSDVVALYHFDANVGGPCVDSGPLGLPGVFGNTTAYGNLQSSVVKWGSNALHVSDQSNFNIQGTSSPHWAVGSSDFTIEFWVYPTTFANQTELYIGATNELLAYDVTVYLTSAGKVGFLCKGTSGSTYASLVSSGALTLNAWNFVQCRRVGSTFAIGIGGSQDTASTVGTAALYAIGTTAVCICGSNTHPQPTYMDDFRMTVGVGRAFALPTAAFPSHG